MIERNHHSLQRALSTSKVLRNFDISLLQKRVVEIQGSAQVSITVMHYMHLHTRMPVRNHNTDYTIEITQTSEKHKGFVQIRFTHHVCYCSFVCRTNNVITLYYYYLTSQALLKEVGEWRRQEEANNFLRRRFEESRQELERVLKKAQGCLRETGDAEELLKKHTVRLNL